MTSHFIKICIAATFIFTGSTGARATFNMDAGYPSGIWDRDYSELVKHRLSQDEHQVLMNLSTGPLYEICPQYHRMKNTDRKNFWVTFFMALAYAESSFNHRAGPMAGIMQLTCDNNARRGYGCSMCTSNERLRKSPLISIDCAMNIVSHWAKRGKLIGSHPYFEVLRRNKHYSRKIKPTIQMYAPKACGNNYKPNGYDWPLKSNKIEGANPFFRK